MQWSAIYTKQKYQVGDFMQKKGEKLSLFPLFEIRKVFTGTAQLLSKFMEMLLSLVFLFVCFIDWLVGFGFGFLVLVEEQLLSQWSALNKPAQLSSYSVFCLLGCFVLFWWLFFLLVWCFLFGVFFQFNMKNRENCCSM